MQSFVHVYNRVGADYKGIITITIMIMIMPCMITKNDYNTITVRESWLPLWLQTHDYNYDYDYM